MLAALIAVVIHQVREELRKLDAAQKPEGGTPGYDPASTTEATVERAAQWDHDTQPPVRATRMGFTARRVP